MPKIFFLVMLSFCLDHDFSINLRIFSYPSLLIYVLPKPHLEPHLVPSGELIKKDVCWSFIAYAGMALCKRNCQIDPCEIEDTRIIQINQMLHTLLNMPRKGR